MKALADFLLSITSEQILEGAKVTAVILSAIMIGLFAPELRRGLDRLTHLVFSTPKVEITDENGQRKIVAAGMPLRLTDDSNE